MSERVNLYDLALPAGNDEDLERMKQLDPWMRLVLSHFDAIPPLPNEFRARARASRDGDTRERGRDDCVYDPRIHHTFTNKFVGADIHRAPHTLQSALACIPSVHMAHDEWKRTLDKQSLGASATLALPNGRASALE
ncbi:hypothetical protein SPRG_11438 [Saprolegnia parasitica CBS 223.65]|uniref:Uncharacterized protein n=1 Tax=Saprolegnia parasitica (strain CBS 223.65) TaxID=695850 RepID=A0A067CAD7_SAPPC|nr:hypothetical protein SPRG_11438 [Saprolegnia parasitica CBS 223.65]KDO23516.1 hypothetical protein SPRG_11438 [Saprolegnia parasitica CBS 223.65]|eukprot:XP_012205829.1 hypothetical protein SPRG_11438 [Saprolegnia parasitica CBS 223.65]